MKIAELFDTREFVGLFGVTFQNALDRACGRLVDFNFVGDLTYELGASDAAAGLNLWDELHRHTIGKRFAGCFRGMVETTDDGNGGTSGQFVLYIPRGLDAGDASVILDNASLQVTIEEFPGL